MISYSIPWLAISRFQRVEGRNLDRHQFAVDQLRHRIGVRPELMIVFEPVLVEAALEPGVEEVGRIGRLLGAEEIECQ